MVQNFVEMPQDPSEGQLENTETREQKRERERERKQTNDLENVSQSHRHTLAKSLRRA